MREYLLIGGPCAGQVVKWHDDAAYVKAMPRTELRLLGDGPADPAVARAIPETTYYREKWTGQDGKERVYMVYPGVSLLDELARVYEHARGGADHPL